MRAARVRFIQQDADLGALEERHRVRGMRGRDAVQRRSPPGAAVLPGRARRAPGRVKRRTRRACSNAAMASAVVALAPSPPSPRRAFSRARALSTAAVAPATRRRSFPASVKPAASPFPGVVQRQVQRGRQVTEARSRLPCGRPPAPERPASAMNAPSPAAAPRRGCGDPSRGSCSGSGMTSSYRSSTNSAEASSTSREAGAPCRPDGARPSGPPAPRCRSRSRGSRGSSRLVAEILRRSCAASNEGTG